MKEIKNITIYKKSTIKTFLEIYYFERIKKIRPFLNLFIVIIVISFFLSDKKTTLDKISFAFALFGIIEINTSMLPKLNYYKLIKTKNKVIDSKVTYLFKERNFSLNNTEYIDYNSLKKIIETETFYYLYINNSKAFIVDKEELKDKEIIELTKKFKENVSTYIYKKNV